MYIGLKYQISLFGNYAEISPNPETVKYFLDQFSVKGFIPNTQNEINIVFGTNPSLNQNTSTQRLRLSNSDGSWNINFGSGRIDFILTNINIDVFKMLDFDTFIDESKDYIKKISQKFSNKHRRIGIVTDYLLFEPIEGLQKKFNRSIPFFEERQLQEWTCNVSAKEKVDNNETLNVISTVRKIKMPIFKNSKQMIFDGVHISFDSNTVDENKNYRFDQSNIDINIDNIVTVLNRISAETFKFVEQDE
ncbi:hypothetical protein EZS27_024643 [termite gut metagenome]|uniref:TIGR04255 family protein n=1 Tax=termite gut metagenome TaxID=433724 RepID=A0A5J4R0F5_9ZZZZ